MPFWPQYKFVTNIKDQIDVKYIFYFETLNNDIMTLIKQLNLSIDLCHINQTKLNHYK